MFVHLSSLLAYLRKNGKQQRNIFFCLSQFSSHVGGISNFGHEYFHEFRCHDFMAHNAKTKIKYSALKTKSRTKKQENAIMNFSDSSFPY